MAWSEPKTDWQPTDPLTHEDYNRIKNNLTYVNDKFNEVYSWYDFNPGADMTIDQMYKASSWNMFEDCVENFQRSGVIYTYGERSYYESNGHLPDFNQLNRLEKCIESYNDITPGYIHVQSISTNLNSIDSYVDDSDNASFLVEILPNDANDKTFSVEHPASVSVTIDGNRVYVKALVYSDEPIIIVVKTHDRELTTNVTVNTLLHGSYYEHNLDYPLDIMLIGKGNGFNTLISKYVLPENIVYDGIYMNNNWESTLNSADRKLFDYLSYDMDSSLASPDQVSPYISQNQGILQREFDNSGITSPMFRDMGLDKSDYDKRYNEVFSPASVKSDYDFSFFLSDADRIAYSIKDKNTKLMYYVRSYYNDTKHCEINYVGYLAYRLNTVPSNIRPLFYLKNTSKVYTTPVNGIYYMCYDNNANSTLVSSLALGSVIRDAPYPQS